MEFVLGDQKESMIARGLSFQKILEAPFLDFIENPAHQGQKILVVQIGEYAVAVPCKSLGQDRWLLVTAYKSRKLTKRYL